MSQFNLNEYIRNSLAGNYEVKSIGCSWELSSKLMMAEIHPHDGGAIKIFDGSAAATACWLSHVKEMFWNMLSLRVCLSVTQSMSSLYHVITPSQELLSSCIIMNNQISGLMYLMTNLNNSKRMNANSKQVPSSTALPEVCPSVLCVLFFLKNKPDLLFTLIHCITGRELYGLEFSCTEAYAERTIYRGGCFLPAYSRKWFNF